MINDALNESRDMAFAIVSFEHSNEQTLIVNVLTVKLKTPDN